MARQAGVVRAVAHRHPHLRGQQHVLALAAERLADDLLGRAGRVDVRCVDEVDPGVEAHADLALGAVDVGAADGAGPADATEGHRAEGENGDAQTGVAECPIFHVGEPSVPRRTFVA
jgi:hypothetical protein